MSLFWGALGGKLQGAQIKLPELIYASPFPFCANARPTFIAVDVGYSEVYVFGGAPFSKFLTLERSFIGKFPCMYRLPL
jgi:hypothetical protein